MDEFRRHARWCSKGLPPSGYRLDVFPEFSAFPVWEAGGMSSPQRLGISAQLAGDLWVWRVWWEQHSEYGGGEHSDAEQRGSWYERGAILVDRLAQETGADIVYCWPDGPDGRDPSCRICGPGRAGDR